MAHRVDPIASRWVPKPFGGLRRMAVLSDRDAAAWHGLIGRMAGPIDSRLPPSVLADRIEASGPRWRLEPVGAALRRARTCSSRIARRAAILVRTDVEAFYASVTPGRLFRALARLGTERADASRAAVMLDGWGSEGYPGLPVGPPGSAVLGNAVLAEVDEALGATPFLRWVDDYLIAAPSEGAAVEVVERLDGCLEDLALRRSVGKSRFLEGGRPLPFPGRSSTAC